MIGWRRGENGTETGLLPAQGMHLPTVAVIAIMTFAMVIVGAAGLALARTAGAVAEGVEHRVVLQLPQPLAGQLPRALASVRAAPEVRSAEAVPEAEMRETLRRWMGEAASADDLPVPALVTIDLAPGTDPEPLRQRLARDVPGATLVAESAELAPLVGSIRALQWLALSLVLLIVTATAAAVVLAARGAFDTHRPTVEIMHGIGATDLQLTKLFQRKIAIDAAIGAAAGAAIAATAILLAVGGGAALAGEFLGRAPLGLRDALVLALLPVVAVVLATGVARWTVLKALRETL